MHCEHHHPANYSRAFAVGVLLNLAYVAAEATYGFLAGSLALLADAGHNLSDVLGLLLAWGAHHLSQWRPTERRTYGWRSTSILAALTNAILLLAAVGAIGWEAIRRLADPQPVATGTVMWVAGLGVAINAATAVLFMSGRRHDLNVRGAFLHMTADAAVSVGVVLAGLGIRLTDWLWLDPAVSLLVAVVILIGTWGLLRDSLNLALQAVPGDIDPTEVFEFLAGRPGVCEVHDLHIWAMSTQHTALTAHLVKPDQADEDAFLADTAEGLHERFGIDHATLQLERDAALARCKLASPHVV